MIRDITHKQFITNWAEYVYLNRKTRIWKKEHSDFINSQINRSNKTLFRIAKVKGFERVAQLRNITNKRALEKYK